MRQEESVPVPRGWTGKAAWKGAGASLLLHLFVGAAVVVALSGPPKPAPQVVDLTLLPPAGIDRHPVPPVFAAAKPARAREGTVLPEPPALPVLPTVANPPDGTAPAIPSDMTAPANPSDMTAAAERIANRSLHPRIPLPPRRPRQARVPSWSRRGVRRGTSGAGSPGGGLRLDPRRHPGARSPTRQRRAGWGGRGRSWWPSTSSRTARSGTFGSCKARGTPPWIGERSTRSETPPRSPGPPSRRRSSPRSSIG